MTRAQIIAAAGLLDWMAGDPEWLPHPVRLIGRCTTILETRLRRPGQSACSELVAGAVLAAGIVGATYLGTTKMLGWAYRLNRSAGIATEILLGWTCLAARNLHDESVSVLRALEAGDLAQARQRLRRIVGRDTLELSETEVARAVIETLAESSCDGIVAPLFYMAIGGVPLAMAYKAVNTLDSMIGHADERYFYFGKVAARWDDAANFVPARLTALGIAVAGGLTTDASLTTAIRIWNRDGSKHKSPNAGQPEAAMAGTLRVRLGGINRYAGELIASPLLGAEFEPPAPRHLRSALRVTAGISLLGAAAACALLTYFFSGASRITTSREVA